MRAQWLLVGVLTVGATLGAARCAPPGAIPDIIRDPVPREEGGLIDLKPDGGLPVRRGIPFKPGADQKKPPCDTDMGEEARYGACYVPVAGRKPPCGKLLEDGEQCFRAVFVAPRAPSSIQR
jgi:hypothetical protein